MVKSPSTIWFWKRVNLIKCVCKFMLITLEFVGPNLWVPRGCIHMSGPAGDYVMNCYGLIVCSLMTQK